MNNTKPKLKEIKEWFFIYRDINIEINNFKMNGFLREAEKDCWTYYLRIPLSMLPKEKADEVWLNHKKHQSKETLPNRCIFDYEKTWLSDLDWHCGATYYKKLEINGNKDDPRLIMVGCDYQHYWDEGHTYNVEKLEFDAKKTVDSLYDKIMNKGKEKK